MNFQPLATQYALQFGVNPALGLAVVDAESAWEPNAVSSAGAKGLMQLMDATGSDYGVTDPFDPNQNLRAGMEHLSYLLDLYEGDMTKALAAYNAGQGAVDKYGGVPPYKETQNYVRKVQNLMQEKYADPTMPMNTQVPMMGAPGPLMPEPQPLLSPEPSMGLFSDPMFQMGASILANSGPGVPFGQAVGAGIQDAMQLQAQQRRRYGQVPANIQEYSFLRQQGVSEEEARRLAFSGLSNYGQRVRMAGNVPMMEYQDASGRITTVPMRPGALGYREDVIRQEAEAAAEGKGFGTARPELALQTRQQFDSVTPALSKTQDLLSRFEAGEFDNVTGPIKGHLSRYWDEGAALMELNAMQMALENLQITNLAPVTEREIDMIRGLYAGVYKTKEQNIAVLKEVQKSLESKRKVLSDVMDMLRKGVPTDEIILREWEVYEPQAPAAAEVPAASPVPPPPPGFTIVR